METKTTSKTGKSSVENKEVPASSALRARTSPKKDRSRSKTIAPKRLSKEEMRHVVSLTNEEELQRPQTREDCLNRTRPCPWVSCKYHLYLDVNPTTGSIKINFPHLNVWEMTHTCALDVADRGGITLEEVGQILNLTRERIRQVEVRGLGKLRDIRPKEDFSDAQS